MSKALIAFLLGITGFVLFMFVGEPLSFHFGTIGLAATFVFLAVYFFFCQFFLSRGNPEALPKDWPIMLALNAIFFITLFFMILSESREVILFQGSAIVISCFGATLAGAFAASWAARRKAVRQ